jgi:hypothetical protein
MSRRNRILLPLVFLVFALYIVYLTFNIAEYKVEVCMEFQGVKACRTASGATREDALSTAKNNACAQLTSGMTNTMRCTAQEPVSVEWLD